jgi:ribose 1,5-bisphosphokinase PhnN
VTRAVYVLGGPGAGKSTAMAALLEGWEVGPTVQLNGLLRGHLLERDDELGVYLGVHRDEFPGTDGLGMAVMPDARAWVDGLPSMDYDLVIGEGARLGTTTFLTELGAVTDLTVLLLDAPDEVLAERRGSRGTGQNETWAKGATTRARNAARGAYDAGNDVFEVDARNTSDEVADIFRLICG